MVALLKYTIQQIDNGEYFASIAKFLKGGQIFTDIFAPIIHMAKTRNCFAVENQAPA